MIAPTSIDIAVAFCCIFGIFGILYIGFSSACSYPMLQHSDMEGEMAQVLSDF